MMSKNAPTATKSPWPHPLLIRLGLARVDTTSHKTITFGDASTVRGGLFWIILSVVMLLILWLCVSLFEWIDPSFLPSPITVWNEFVQISQEGYRNVTLMQYLTTSLFRILAGFAIGCIVGIPLGFAMGLSNPVRGLFDPIVEFLRFIPTLALIPLVIILWQDFGEPVKVFLISMAVVWIMTIAARSGVLSVKLSKVHSAYSLGASKTQLLRYVILPSALPEIFIGMRVALRFSWETLLMVELLSPQAGIGQMIWMASKFFKINIVIIGIIMIGLIGLAMEMMIRMIEARLIPWAGRG